MRPRYIIINDTDQPYPPLVAQLVSEKRGYCYLNRRFKEYDGMTGVEGTDIREFGISYSEDLDGIVRFRGNDIPPTAKYRDGQPRRWQSPIKDFEYTIIK